MTGKADILVIGGGVAGISAAAEAADGARVIVLEAEPGIGRHATGRSAAAFILNYGNATLRALNAAAWPTFAEPGDLADAPLVAPRGVLLTATEDERDALEAELAGASGMTRIGTEEALRIAPILRPEAAVAAAWEPDAQDIDVDLLLQGYARRLRTRGGRVVSSAAVDALARTGGVWRAETPEGAFEAPLVVNAAGAWADIVAATAGLAPLGLVPKRRSAAILPAPEGCDLSRWPLFGSVAERWYARPMGGKLMVSPADQDPVPPGDAWPDDMVLAEGLHRFECAVTMPVTRVERSWAGLRTFAPDKTPVVGFDPRTEGFLWLAGQGGYGIQTAPALAALAAALLHGREPALEPEVAAALRPGRLSPR